MRSLNESLIHFLEMVVKILVLIATGWTHYYFFESTKVIWGLIMEIS
jgi:hypothetical protein